MYQLCPSILSADFNRLGEQIKTLEKEGIEWLHIDVMDGDPIILINPEIIETSGEQTDEEGCLSIPGKCASVTRADYVKVKSFDMDLNPVIIEGEGLRARALLHEMDHLDGILYGERANEPYHDVEEEECE